PTMVRAASPRSASLTPPSMMRAARGENANAGARARRFRPRPSRASCAGASDTAQLPVLAPVGQPAGTAAFGRQAGAGCELQPALAHPADRPSGIANDQRVISNVAGDDGTRADEGVGTNRVSAHNRAVSAQRCASFDQRWLVLVFSR